MWIEKYAMNLQMLVQQRYIGPFLAPGSKEVLLEYVVRLHDVAQQARRNRQWVWTIPRERPLTFRENEQRLQVDLAGKIAGEGDNVVEVRTLMRVWSLDSSMCYRVGIDSVEIEEKLRRIGRRVLVRYHFDCRAGNATRPEPFYHLQVGGNAVEDENCWFPIRLDIPRFHFPPMDIVLLCELVLVNFFDQQSEDLRKKPEWVSLVRKSQEAFQGRYFQEFFSILKDETNTLLGHLASMRLHGIGTPKKH
ncbi:MAG: hypothetical protein AB1512_01125 [Thermodesulfobacteriota bacterium]